MTRRRQLVVLACLLGLVASIAFARLALGLDLDPESVRGFVAELGWWGPLAFVLITTFRVPLGLPSQLVLVAGGIVFGTLLATACGAVGLTCSAVIVFTLGRLAGRDALRARLGERFAPFVDAAGSRLGATFLAVGTGYPLGPITAYHGLAGVTDMALRTFVIAVGIGSAIRAATFTYFGSSLVGGDLSRIAQAGLVVLAALLVPLAFPRPRAWIREMVLARSAPARDPRASVPGKGA